MIKKIYKIMVYNKKYKMIKMIMIFNSYKNNSFKINNQNHFKIYNNSNSINSNKNNLNNNKNNNKRSYININTNPNENKK